MPNPPSVISFSRAAHMVAGRLGLSPKETLDLLISACCDGAVESWGHYPGTMPEAISILQWNQFHYEGRPLPFDIENIEVITPTLLKWLLVDWDQTSEADTSTTALNPPDRPPGENSADRAAVRRRRGPVPLVKLRVKSEMMEAMKKGLDLTTLKEEAMKAQFRASRQICRDARKELLSEIVDLEQRQMPTSDK